MGLCFFSCSLCLPCPTWRKPKLIPHGNWPGLCSSSFGVSPHGNDIFWAGCTFVWMTSISNLLVASAPKWEFENVPVPGAWQEKELSRDRLPVRKIAPWSSRWFEEILVALIWLALICLTLIWVTFFLSKFLLFSLNIYYLGTHLSHTQVEQIWPNRTFTHCFTIISIY